MKPNTKERLKLFKKPELIRLVLELESQLGQSENEIVYLKDRGLVARILDAQYPLP